MDKITALREARNPVGRVAFFVTVDHPAPELFKIYLSERGWFLLA